MPDVLTAPRLPSTAPPVGPRVVAAAPHADGSARTLLLTYSDGSRRRFDATPYVGRGIFAAFADPNYFCQATVDPRLGTVVWPDGQDFCPDTMHAEGTPIG